MGERSSMVGNQLLRALQSSGTRHAGPESQEAESKSEASVAETRSAAAFTESRARWA